MCQLTFIMVFKTVKEVIFSVSLIKKTKTDTRANETLDKIVMCYLRGYTMWHEA